MSKVSITLLIALTIAALVWFGLDTQQSVLDLQKPGVEATQPSGMKLDPVDLEQASVQAQRKVPTESSTQEFMFEEPNLDPTNYNQFQLDALEKARRGQRLTERELSDLLSFLVDREFNRKACIHPDSDFLNTQTWQVLSQRNHSLEHWQDIAGSSEPSTRVGAQLLLANLYRKGNWLDEYEQVSLTVLPFLDSRSQFIVLERVADTLLKHARINGDSELESRAAPYLFVLLRDYEQTEEHTIHHQNILSRIEQDELFSGVDTVHRSLTDQSWQQPGDKKISAIPLNRPLTEEQKDCLAGSY